ncbi:MAG TPA: protein kinase [Ilumatobacteraceae bacterium]|nr:protein kinase [Ilumatobacteraceae bacterium]
MRVEADLRLGSSGEVVSELKGLVRQHPLRERLVASLMLALYRCGRTAEALRAFAAFRERLVAEVGVDPSRSIRELEQQILNDDESLMIDRESAAATNRPRTGLTVRGYELREMLGHGAFGAVYRAYQPIVGREVAIKVIAPELADDPTFIRRFEAEAQIVAGLEHPHIVPLYDYWREPRAAYLVMRLVGHSNLADTLADGALPPGRAASMFAQLASALQSAHRSGVIHGDVKPENILIDRDGNAYLTDFGMAFASGEAHATGAESGSTGASLDAPYASPEQLGGRPMSPASDVYSLAVVAARAVTGKTGDYESVRGALPATVRTVLDRATDRDPLRRYSSAAVFGQALSEALGVASSPLPEDVAVENPYKGLRAFATADAADFFGRERLVERLIARLREPGPRGRFVAVVGPSGSGKSSVVRAGLVPALAAGALPMSQDWFRVEMTPAPHPFEELEAALSRVAIEAPASMIDIVLATGGVRRAVERVLPDGTDQLLLVIDQFEELFTQVDDETAIRFIDELVGLITAPSSRTRVIVTLRADFYDRPLRHRGLGELLRDGTEVITPMSIEELEAAITGPAGRAGVTVDSLVVAEMVGEIVDRPGALPLMQYTLTELFDARIDRTITIGAYRAGGGISRTLAKRADSLLSALGPEAADTVRHVFLRLVSLDDDSAPTRRRTLAAELEELDQRGRVQRVLDTFGRHRLLSFDRDPVTRGPTVEISHEALLAEWATLRDWIESARDDLRTHRHLAVEMNAWLAAGKSADYLLRGGRLDSIVAWSQTTTMGLRPPEHEFLDASLALRTEEQRARSVEQRRTTDAERRARRRSRQLLIAALTTALVAALAVFAWAQREDAREAQADLVGIQEAQRLANVAASALSTDSQLSLLLAMEAVRATSTLGFAVPEALDAIHWALQDMGAQYDVAPDTLTAARFGPAGVRGVWALPVEQLMNLAEASTARSLSTDECRLYFEDGGCPPDLSAAGLQYFGGLDTYTNAVAFDQTEVVVVVAGDPGEWQQNLDALGEQYGVRVRVRQLPDNVTATEAIKDGFPGDIFVVDPRDLRELSDVHPLIDVRAFVDEQTMLADYGAHLVSLSRIGDDGQWPSGTGAIHGAVVGLNSKSLIWTNEPEFTDLGYARPSDWASFMDLAGAMVADGQIPFCLGIESDQADGWPATDWVETIVLRTAGPDFYDRWITHQVPFDDPIVVNAIRTVGAMVHTPGFLDTSPAEAADRPFHFALHEFVEMSGCLMTPFPSFMPSLIGPFQNAVGTFPFPAFGRGHDDAVVGGHAIAVAITDRPEVRQVIAALASPDFGAASAQLDWPSILPANARFDVSAMSNPEVARIVSGVQAAIRSDEFRFDASDAMPPEIGEGAFWNGMLRLFREGSAENVDQLSLDIAREIEAAWRELEGSA